MIIEWCFWIRSTWKFWECIRKYYQLAFGSGALIIHSYMKASFVKIARNMAYFSLWSESQGFNLTNSKAPYSSSVLPYFRNLWIQHEYVGLPWLSGCNDMQVRQWIRALRRFKVWSPIRKRLPSFFGYQTQQESHFRNVWFLDWTCGIFDW
jgi:hypothetical protein